MTRLSRTLLWLAPLVLLAPVYLTGRALFWGTPLLQFIPWWKTAWDTLLSGHLPLWNPGVGMGAPLLANYQSALLYPVTWGYLFLYLLGGVRWMAWGQALSVALHLAWSAAGTARLARRLGLGDLAQVVGGLAYGLCGYLVSRAGFLSINAAASWLPWVLLTLTALIELIAVAKKTRTNTTDAAGGMALSRPVFRAFMALTACLAMQLLSGHAQTAWYTMTLAGIWALYFGWHAGADGGRLRSIGESLLCLAVAVLLAAGIAAAQLVPTAEYLAASQRSSAVEYAYAMNYSFWPWDLLTLFAPGMFGSPASGDFWGYANYWENAVYIGILPLFLALSTLRAAWRRTALLKGNAVAGATRSLPFGCRPTFLRFMWFLILVAFIFALGSFTPLYPWLYRNIPTFSMFQAPARWLIWAEIALALLAAAGADAWRRPRGRALYWTRLGAAGALAAALGAGLGMLLLGDVSPSFVRAIALFGLWAMGAALLSQAAPPSAHPLPPEPTGSEEQLRPLARLLGRIFPALSRPRPRKSSRDKSLALPVRLYSLPLWQLAAALWVALDLLVAGWGLNPSGPLDLYDPSPVAGQARELASGGRLYIPAAQKDWLMYSRFLRFETFDPGEDWRNMRAVNLPNANLLDNLPSTNQFDPLTPANYAGLLEILEQAAPTQYPQLVKLMDIGVVQNLARHAQNGIRLIPTPRGGRVRFAECAVWASDAVSASGHMLSGTLDFNRQVVLQGKGVDTDCHPAEGSSPAVQVYGIDTSSPNSLSFTLQTDGPGWVWVADVDYPGWRAYLDSQPAPILRANYAFRAVQIPAPGEHTIQFVYQPVSFYAGLLISVLSLLLYFAFFAIKRINHA